MAMTGGCLCGAIRYELAAQPNMMGHCHCSRCRRFTGGACSWEITVLRETVRVVRGDELLGEYQGRNFCPRCGSSLFWGYRGGDGQPIVGVAAGTLDPEVDPGVRPMAHAHVASKAPWVALHDMLPKLAVELGSDMLENDDPACAAAPVPGSVPAGQPPSVSRSQTLHPGSVPAGQPPPAAAVTGACFCGDVRYSVTPPLGPAYSCHCSLCRRFSGNAAAEAVPVRAKQFHLVAGGEVLRTFRWEDRKEYVFCSRCGSSLCVVARWPPAPDAGVSIRMGTFDGDPGVRLQSHIYVDSAAVWETIEDHLPQFAEAPE